VGNFYKNVTLFGPPRDAVIAALAGHERTAYVSPTERSFTVVYDRNSDEAGGPDALSDLSMTLYADLAGAALPRWPLFLFESTRHRLIAGALGMPPWAHATGYRYIAQDEPPPGLDESDLEHVGRGPGRQ